VVCCASAKTQVQNFELACANIIVQNFDKSQVRIFDPKLPQAAASPRKICRSLGSGYSNHRKLLLAAVQKLGKPKN
jgi:hypothetical protein